MWHELRVVLHNRENVLLSKLVQDLAREEQGFADSVLANWISLSNDVEEMPYE
jgi:sorting nexin-8